MIEEPPLLTLRRNFTRPTKVQVDAFRGVQTGFVVDAMKGRGALDGRIKPCRDDQAIFCGVAVTCHAGPADILAPFSAIEISGPGDIVVVATCVFVPFLLFSLYSPPLSEVLETYFGGVGLFLCSEPTQPTE